MTNQMMHRHERTIHHYMQKTSSKQIPRKKWWEILEAVKKAYQTLAGCKPEKLLVWKLCMTNTAAKLKFVILKFNVTFINKSHGDTERRCVI